MQSHLGRPDEDLCMIEYLMVHTYDSWYNTQNIHQTLELCPENKMICSLDHYPQLLTLPTVIWKRTENKHVSKTFFENVHLTCLNVFKTMHLTLLSLFWLLYLPHAVLLRRFLTPISEREWTKAINLDLVSKTVNDWYHCGLLWNFKIPHGDNESYQSIHSKANAFIVLKFQIILPYRTFHKERHRRNCSLQPIFSTFWSKTLHQAKQTVHTAVTSSKASKSGVG